MENKKLASGILLLSSFLVVEFILVFPVAADRGLLPLNQKLIEESDQNAIIAWNGEEEILILSTKVKANSTVVEFIPLPSKPIVERASPNSFYVLARIVGGKAFSPGFGFGTKNSIVFEKVIGPHHLTVVEINSSREFKAWMEGFIEDKDVDDPDNLNSSINAFSEIMEDYISRGYRYLAIDVISVSGERTVEPLFYSFKSDKIYYPLRITSKLESPTKINLFILSYGIPDRDKLEKYGFELKEGFSYYIRLNKKELKEVDSRIGILNEAYYTHIYFDGSPSDLQSDIELRVKTPSSLDIFLDWISRTSLFQTLFLLRSELFIFAVLSLLGYPAVFLMARKVLISLFIAEGSEVNLKLEGLLLITAFIPVVLLAFATGFVGMIVSVLLFLVGSFFFIGRVLRLVAKG